MKLDITKNKHQIQQLLRLTIEIQFLKAIKEGHKQDEKRKRCHPK